MERGVFQLIRILSSYHSTERFPLIGEAPGNGAARLFPYYDAPLSPVVQSGSNGKVSPPLKPDMHVFYCIISKFHHLF